MLSNGAVEFLYKKCKDVVRNNFWGTQKHYDDQDLTQELFIKVMEALPKYDKERGKFSTFFSRVAYIHLMYLINVNPFYSQLNLSLDNKVKSNTERTFADFIEDNRDVFLEIETRLDMEIYLNKLSGRKRDVLKNILAGFSVQEIAEKFNCSVQNIYNTMYKIRSQFELESQVC